jgi:acyl-CoA synthetase (AMP-forming)/AMP-acid ligase II
LESLPTTIADIVKIRALATPDALAILAPGRSPLAFGALARAIDATIQSLARAGYGRGDRVALALARGSGNGGRRAVGERVRDLHAAQSCIGRSVVSVALSTLRADAVIVAGEDSPARARPQHVRYRCR